MCVRVWARMRVRLQVWASILAVCVGVRTSLYACRNIILYYYMHINSVCTYECAYAYVHVYVHANVGLCADEYVYTSVRVWRCSCACMCVH